MYAQLGLAPAPPDETPPCAARSARALGIWQGIQPAAGVLASAAQRRGRVLQEALLG